MSWPAYPEYKNSGSHWIGPIPKSWKIAQFKRVANRITDGAHVSPETEGGVYDFVSTRDVNDKGIDFYGSLKTSPDSYDYLVRNGCRPEIGDVLFSKDGTIGRTVVVTTDHPFVVASSLIIIKPNRRESNPVYFHYLCQATCVTKQVDSHVQGAGLPRLSIKNLNKIFGPFPPVAEQQQIVSFLDHETSKIDALISKQEQLIATLREDRNVTIANAVTKGLDPNVEMKESGVEWIGNVPKTWPIQRLSWLFREISSGTTPSSDRPDYYDGEINWVTTGELRESTIVETSKKVTSQAIVENSALRIYPPGSLLIAMYGATIGRLGILGVPACTNQACCVFSQPVNVNVRFAFYALRAAREHLIVLASGGGQPNINQDKLRSLRIALPPLAEQACIVSRLDSRLDEIDALIDKADRVIDTLREYRSALITAAVTGKIDVRGGA